MLSGAGFVVALLGAESSGKSMLAQELATALAARGSDVATVPETLREFCSAAGRTPHVHEQAAIARTQTGRIDAAACDHAVVVCDTTALSTAVYSDLIFGDASLYPMALQAQRRYALTLLLATDLPWQADGFQRDGPQMRARIDTRLREVLLQSGIAYSVVRGVAAARLDAALAVVDGTRRRRGAADGTVRRWRWNCPRCDGPDDNGHAGSALSDGT